VGLKRLTELPRKFVNEAICGFSLDVYLRHFNAPPSLVISSPSNAASTRRRMQAGKPNDTGVHSVVGKALFDFSLST
jgi:hypothetical protein